MGKKKKAHTCTICHLVLGVDAQPLLKGIVRLENFCSQAVLFFSLPTKLEVPGAVVSK